MHSFRIFKFAKEDGEKNRSISDFRARNHETVKAGGQSKFAEELRLKVLSVIVELCLKKLLHKTRKLLVQCIQVLGFFM